ncbi:MAG: riboflavin synthase, partial [Acinetobacter sp.]|nr:riboflavin synthase [Acinetobacter sp.]
CSLTVNQVDHANNLIAVDLIPETIRITTFKSVQIGDALNFEIDQTTRTLVDTIKATLQQLGKL